MKKLLHPLIYHLLNGRRITLLPHENVNEEDINDPDYGNLTTITKRARRMALLLQHFRNRWKNEYLTSLREFHRTTGKNKQTINIGDVVLVHDDKPRIKWKLAVIKNLTEGKDGYVQYGQLTYAQRTEKQIDRSPSYILSKYVQPLQQNIQLKSNNP